jgi:hypothetical protein
MSKRQLTRRMFLAGTTLAAASVRGMLAAPPA